MERRRLLVPLALALVVLAGSLAPASGAPTEGGLDKLYHVAGYVALAFATCWAVRERAWRALAGVVFVVTAFGVGVEVVQPAFGRDASVLDALADLLGACVGALAWRLGPVSRTR